MDRSDVVRAQTGVLDALIAELSIRPGRGVVIARITITSAICVALAMTFRIPLPTYLAYIVFLISKDEASTTLKAGAGSLAAATGSVALALCLAMVDSGEPGLRIPLMALATFLAMWTARTFALGPVSFLAGFVLVMLQSLTDDASSTEALTRSILWLWVVAFVPIATSCAIGLLFGDTTAAFIVRESRNVLLELRRAVTSRSSKRRVLICLDRALLIGERLSDLSEPELVQLAVSPAAVRALPAMVMCIAALPDETSIAARTHIATMLQGCLDHPPIKGLGSQAPASNIKQSDFGNGAPTATYADAAAIAACDAIATFNTALSHRDPTPHLERRARPTLFVSDAFRNPEHVRHALKTTIAVLIVYFTYTMLNWPGLQTSITTCFFVSLASFGETVHKLLLRLSGALIGGAMAALTIVYLLPRMTDIGELLLLIACASALTSWVATSSERIAYAGYQMAFAFFLGVLQAYGPATDLTVLRDRVAGILLGNIVITLVFSVLWPVPAARQLRQFLTDLLGTLATLLAAPADNDEAKLRAASAYASVDHFRQMTGFEDGFTPAKRPRPFIGFEDLARSAFVVTTPSLRASIDSPQLDRCASWIRDLLREDKLRTRSSPRKPAESEQGRDLHDVAGSLRKAAVAAVGRLELKATHES